MEACLLHSQGFSTLVCVCGDDLSDNTKPKWHRQSSELYLNKLFTPAPCSVRLKKRDSVHCCCIVILVGLVIHLSVPWWNQWHFAALMYSWSRCSCPPLHPQRGDKWTLSVCCLGVTGSANGNYPPIQPYIHDYTVNTNSIIVFTAEHCINLWPIIVEPIVTMWGSIYCNQKTDRDWKHC